MPVQHHTVVPIGDRYVDGLRNLNKILIETRAIVGTVSAAQRTAVATQLQRVEIETRVTHGRRDVIVKEVVHVAVHVQQRTT